MHFFKKMVMDGSAVPGPSSRQFLSFCSVPPNREKTTILSLRADSNRLSSRHPGSCSKRAEFNVEMSLSEGRLRTQQSLAVHAVHCITGSEHHTCAHHASYEQKPSHGTAWAHLSTPPLLSCRPPPPPPPLDASTDDGPTTPLPPPRAPPVRAARAG